MWSANPIFAVMCVMWRGAALVVVTAQHRRLAMWTKIQIVARHFSGATTFSKLFLFHYSWGGWLHLNDSSNMEWRINYCTHTNAGGSSYNMGRRISVVDEIAHHSCGAFRMWWWCWPEFISAVYALPRVFVCVCTDNQSKSDDRVRSLRSYIGYIVDNHPDEAFVHWLWITALHGLGCWEQRNLWCPDIEVLSALW